MQVSRKQRTSDGTLTVAGVRYELLGSANDVPITAMSRAIEIDLRDLMNERELPAPHAPQRNILM